MGLSCDALLVTRSNLDTAKHMMLAPVAGNRATAYYVFLSALEDLAQPYCYGIGLCGFGKLLKETLTAVLFEKYQLNVFTSLSLRSQNSWLICRISRFPDFFELYVSRSI